MNMSCYTAMPFLGTPKRNDIYSHWIKYPSLFELCEQLRCSLADESVDKVGNGASVACYLKWDRMLTNSCMDRFGSTLLRAHTLHGCIPSDGMSNLACV